METASETCGCKGVRFCSLCENSERSLKLKRNDEKPSFESFETFLLCSYDVTSEQCRIRRIDNQPIFSLEELFCLRSEGGNCEINDTLSSYFNDKLILIENFIDEEEESNLVRIIDTRKWALSQSGRRKQDYGPRVNFKGQKLKVDAFIGMPTYCGPLLGKMQQLSNLKDYIPFEVCNLEYDNNRGSSIDFHIDDTWIWGERLISINLLDASVMTLINEELKAIIYIPMPRRSLLCIAGKMRYEWKHGIFRHHICGRRIALTMREPSYRFQFGGELYEKYGKELISKANCFI